MEPHHAQSFRHARFAAVIPGGGLSLPTRLGLIAGAFVLTVVALLLVVPALFVGGLVFLAAAAAAAARRRVRGLRAPGGALDGRRNVRVIVRDGPP